MTQPETPPPVTFPPEWLNTDSIIDEIEYDDHTEIEVGRDWLAWLAVITIVALLATGVLVAVEILQELQNPRPTQIQIIEPAQQTRPPFEA